MPNNLQQYKTELDEQYERAKSSTDTRSFFTHLYLYMQIIQTNEKLSEFVGRGVSDVHADLYPDDAASMPNFTKGNAPNPFLISKWLTQSLTSDKGQVQLFYCWLRLTLFYGIRKHPLDSRNEYSNQPQYKLNILIINKEFNNIFKKNSDSDNHIFKTEQYRLCIDVFHPWLMKYHTNNIDADVHSSEGETKDDSNEITASASGKTAQTIPKEHQAELVFHGQTTPIVRYQGYNYVFNSLDENFDPWKIISYCWTYMLDKEVSLNELQKDADVNAPKGIKEALRKSPLFIKTKNKKGALSPFLKGLSKQYITILRYTPLTNDELKIIENVAIDKTKS